MANSLPPELVKRAIYSKYLLKRAETLLADGNELASAEAVLTAHDSVEMLMRVVYDHVQAVPAREFMGFWKVIKDKVGIEPPRYSAIDRLNHQRNGFKHKGILPDRGGVRELLRAAVAFSEEISQAYLHADYQSFSLADLIQNTDARDKVKEAERARASGNLKDGVTQLGLALDALFHDKQQKSETSLIGEIRLSLGFTTLGGSSDLELRRMTEKLTRMAEVVDSLFLGINPAQQRRFKNITPVRHQTASGKVLIEWLRDPDGLTVEDFEFCYAFVVDFGLRLVSN